MKLAFALTAALLATPALAVTMVHEPGPRNGIHFSGDQPKFGGGSTPQHWNPHVAVGPFPAWASQHPDGPGARGLPPALGNRYICMDFVTNSPKCGRRVAGPPVGVPPVVTPPVITPPVLPPVGQPPVVTPPPTVNPIPLPASAWLLWGGVLALFGLRQRTRAAQVRCSLPVADKGAAKMAAALAGRAER